MPLIPNSPPNITGHLPARQASRLFRTIAPTVSRLLPAECCVLCAKVEHSPVCSGCLGELTLHTHYCHGCAIPLGESHLSYCGSCLEDPLEFDRVYALYTYTPLMQEFIHRFKYGKNLSIGGYFAQHIAEFYTTAALDYDAIIPMPLHPKRIKHRGFNQSAELMRHLPNAHMHSVVRSKYTKEMNSLSSKERKKEIKGAFHVKHLREGKILLVDDVLTTATSTNELTKTIRTYYKQHALEEPTIDVLVLARAVLG